mgnify:CR=1 FL=1
MKYSDLFKETKELMQKGDYKKCISNLKKLVKSNPDNILLKLYYAKNLINSYEARERGFSLLDKIYNSKNKNLAAVELGRHEKQNGNTMQALNYFYEAKNDKRQIGLVAIIEIIYLYILEGKYEEAYELFMNNVHLLKLNSICNTEHIEFYLAYKMGYIEKLNPTDYFCRMLIDYDENSVINHINSNANISLHDKFKDDVDISSLYYFVLDKIKDYVPLKSTLVDNYIVKCHDSISTINNKETSFIEVCTYINTKKIITMYPVLCDYYDKIPIKKLV